MKGRREKSSWWGKGKENGRKTVGGCHGEMRETTGAVAEGEGAPRGLDFYTVLAELSQGLRLPGRVRSDSSSSTHSSGLTEGFP